MLFIFLIFGYKYNTEIKLLLLLEISFFSNQISISYQAEVLLELSINNLFPLQNWWTLFFPSYIKKRDLHLNISFVISFYL